MFKLNSLRAELQAKDTTITKLKTQIKCVPKTSTSESVKRDLDEIETINIGLEHRVSKLIVKNEHSKQTYKQLYDSIKPTCVRVKEHSNSLIDQLNKKSVENSDLNAQLQENVLVITALKDDLRKLKGKDIVDNAAQASKATDIASGMYKLDPVTLAPRDKNNRETHTYYLKHTMEQAAILSEIVEQVKSLNPLDSASYTACKYVKMIQEVLGYVRDTCPDIHKPSKKLVAVTPINKKKTVRFAEPVISSSASQKQLDSSQIQAKQTTNNFVLTSTEVSWSTKSSRITTTNKVPHREHIPLEAVAQEPVVTKVYTRRSKFLGTVKFANDQIAKIMGYGDYQIGNVIISRVYYVEELRHNLFLVGQFYESDLEVAFRKHTCFVRNLEGVDLLLGSRETNLYTLSIGDMIVHGLVRGLPKLKFEKDHLCSACAIGKSKKQSHKLKFEDTNQEKLYLLHMDLCGPMRVANVNEKKYILVIMDDYSWFTWVKFLASKDEAPDFIIKFLKMIQVKLNTPIRNIRTDNETEFANQTLRSYYESVGM
ncbi:retrovirus-related pol polyprotein from transposon TNT 1-94 [Tanacetum coccineum]